MIKNEMTLSLKIVRILMFTYSIILVAGLINNYFDNGVEDKADFVRGLFRSVIFIYLATQLNSYRKWVWWVVILFCGFIGMLSLAGIATFYFYAGINTEMNSVYIMGIPVVTILFSIFALMLKKSTRILFSKS